MAEEQRGAGSSRARGFASRPAAAKQTASRATGERSTGVSGAGVSPIELPVARQSGPRRIVERRAAAPTKAKAKGQTEPLSWPRIERRVADKSLLERRLLDPTAKERRKTAVGEQPIEVDPTSQRAKGTSKERGRKQPTDDLGALRADGTPSADGNGGPQRSGREGGATPSSLRGITAWASQLEPVAIALHGLTLFAVAALWYVSSSHWKEMAKASAASGEAAYEACLGSQTLRNELMQLKATSGGLHLPAAVGLPLPSPESREKAAQLTLDVDKAASVGAHMPVLFHLGIQNSGKTAALHEKVWGAVKLVETNREPDFRYGEASQTKASVQAGDASQLVLYTTNHGAVAPLNDADIGRVNSGEAYVVAYGRVEYEDIFGVKHWVEFCHHVTEPVGATAATEKCTAYNAAGASEPGARAVATQRGAQSPEINVPEIACKAPLPLKN